MKNKNMLWFLGAAVVLVGVGVGIWSAFLLKDNSTRPGIEKKPIVRPIEESKDKVQVEMYFPNRKYVETGDESLPKFLTVKSGFDKKDPRLAEKVVRTLQKNPDNPALDAVIRSGLEVHDVRVEKGIAYVDFSGKNLFGGSLEETMLVQSLVRTLTGLEGIEKVQFLVDGQPRETLMGHISTMEPIGKEDL